MNWWALVLGSYLVGSIPFGYLIGRFGSGVDVRTVGSGNVGATNVLRTAGKIPGLCVLVLDMAKGTLPVIVAMNLNAPSAVVGAVAVAVVCGHIFSVFMRFRGGKGVATAIGAFLPLAPMPAILSLTVFALVLLWKRYVSLASVAAVATFPTALLVLQSAGWIPNTPRSWVVAASIVAVMIVARHSENFQRIASGREARIGEALEVRSR